LLDDIYYFLKVLFMNDIGEIAAATVYEEALEV
jgi:hypothetical protein